MDHLHEAEGVSPIRGSGGEWRSTAARLLMARRRNWRLFTLAVSFGVLILISTAPAPDGLTQQGQKALAIFAMCIILWVTHAFPLAVTSFLAIALLPIMKVMDPGEAFALFGNEAVFFIMGAFILAAALLKSGLSTRIALIFLSRFGGNPEHLLLGVLASSAFLAFWMPAHAVAALMFPIILQIARSLGLEPGRSSYGKALFFSLAWGSIIGGVATLLGGARNPLAIGILWQHHHLRLGFGEWMVAAVPITVVMLCCAYGVIRFFFRIDVADISRARDALRAAIDDLGKVSWPERWVGVVVGGTICCWIGLSHTVGLANIAVLGAVSLFVLNLVRWNDIEDYVNWGVILMYGGAIAVATALTETGAAQWLVVSLLTRYELTPFMLVAAISLVAKVLTEGISNAAAVAVLLPIGFSLGEVYGVHPVLMVYAVAIPSGLAFSLPMGTPPNAICYSSGYYGLREALKAGFVLNVASWIAFLLMVKLYWPLIGVRL